MKVVLCYQYERVYMYLLCRMSYVCVRTVSAVVEHPNMIYMYIENLRIHMFIVCIWDAMCCKDLI